MAYNYEFNNPESMSRVCGVNDSNISYFEELFNCKTAVRGTRLEFSAEDACTAESFSALLSKLERLSEIEPDISKKEILLEFKSLSSGANGTLHINVGSKAVFPKSRKQEEYIASMKGSQVVFAIGPAGTGKTILAVNYCLGELFAGRKQKIILTRPVVEAGESLGFLPGDLSQKLNPYLKPLYDSMEATVAPSTVKRLEESGQIEIAPLAYMRGRSINNACIILDEAQNTTRTQMKMFLTRLGENSCAIITGDITQIDLPKAETSGLKDACERLSGVEGVSVVSFSGSDTVRSRIVQRIIKAYEENR